MGDYWGEHTDSNAFGVNTSRTQQTAQEVKRAVDDLFKRDPSDFDLTSIKTAVTATIRFEKDIYKFYIIPSGRFDGGPIVFEISNIHGEEDMADVKTEFLKKILNIPIVLTVDDMNMKPAYIIISPATSSPSSNVIGGLYEFKLVPEGPAEGGGGAAIGGKSVRRRSRKCYSSSRRRRVSNKKYSASRRGRGSRRGRKN